MKIVECPRDGLQGIKNFIPTVKKIELINTLLEVGFDTIDIGSFVSPKAFPQMVDTDEVINNINYEGKTKLLALVVNKMGSDMACQFDQISYLGFPFSISNTFLERNVNSNIPIVLQRFHTINECALACNKKMLVYFSMGFGNPYGDPWNLDILDEYIEYFIDYGVDMISMSDTIGISKVDDIKEIFTFLIEKYPKVEFGFHLHSRRNEWFNRINAAYESGVEKFDSVIGGLGGCPSVFDSEKLISNLETKNLIHYFDNKGININLNLEKYNRAEELIKNIKSIYL